MAAPNSDNMISNICREVKNGKYNKLNKIFSEAIRNQDKEEIVKVLVGIFEIYDVMDTLGKSLSNDEYRKLKDRVHDIIEMAPWKYVTCFSCERKISIKVKIYLRNLCILVKRYPSCKVLHKITKIAEVFDNDIVTQPSLAARCSILSAVHYVLKKISSIKYYQLCLESSLNEITFLKKFVKLTKDSILEATPSELISLSMKIVDEYAPTGNGNISGCTNYLIDLERQIEFSLDLIKKKTIKIIFRRGKQSLELFPRLASVKTVSELLPDDDNTRELCSVCLKDVARNFAILDNCKHNFCWECIQTWANDK